MTADGISGDNGANAERLIGLKAVHSAPTVIGPQWLTLNRASIATLL